jgi:polysaccharide pyruvyl transferase WcaK-like protein
MNLVAETSVAVLGDMRDLHHHGCEAVMAELIQGLTRHGLKPLYELTGLNWKEEREICESVDILVINGEGALHHDRPVIPELLELANLRQKTNKKTILLNTSWFENSAQYSQELATFSLVSTRESVSAKQITDHGGPFTLLAPDLAITYAVRRKFRYEGSGRVMVSDSTKPILTAELRRLAASRNWNYLPVLAYPELPRPGAKSRKIYRRARLARCLGSMSSVILGTRYHAHAVGVTKTQDYLHHLAASTGVVTGRFHTVCFALAIGVPFIAIKSNTPKIEAIVRDAGLDPSKRILSIEELKNLEMIPAFDEQESKALAEFASSALGDVETLFSRITDTFRAF